MLAEAWAEFWPGCDVDAMRADVLARVDAAITEFGLCQVTPLDGGVVAAVFAARRNREPVVLKVNPRGTPEDAALAAQATALRVWATADVAPAVLDSRDDDLTLLLERVVPGTPLDDTQLSWDDRLTLIGTAVARLHAASPPTAPSVPPLEDYIAEWPVAVPPGLLDGPRVLLHLDLHGGNLLSHGDGWRAIDPHAAWGDPHADVWALIDPLAPLAATPAELRAWIRRYAEAAGLEPDRAAAWVRLRAAAEATNGADGEAEWAGRLRRTAELLADHGRSPA